MSFQDLQNDGKTSSVGRSSSQNPSQTVAAGIFQINTAVAGFRRLVDAIGTSKDTPDHRQKLHNSRQRIGQLVKETSAKLKSLSDSDHASNVNPRKKVEDAKLARDFQATLQDFQKAQQLAAERESAYAPSIQPTSSLTSSYHAFANSSSSAENEASDRDHESQPFLSEQRRQEVLLLGNEVAFNEAIIEEREQGIKDIQQEIGQANEIFRDLAVLVHEQGVVIDDIQSNIEASSAATTQAKVQLSKAHKNVKSRSSWCWWVLVIFVLVVVILLLFLII
ncbi:syntaxin-22-like isoform X1 [Telopea speciosissima]|uniref:syntaxin-22-like isoform X1 n=1 Tax=Telopea speciosissima TaxID=54955 RepID=UPI001CC34B17|nr:syntaxin-22-like isoform X1 [Telopea speciosissima]